MGPVVSREHRMKIEKYLQLAREEKLEVIVGGEIDEKLQQSKKGYYLMPTVILNLDDQSKLMTEEIFGPVVCIVPFDTEEEVKIFYANFSRKKLRSFDFWIGNQTCE